jgi:hypothetical protein
MSLLQSTDDDQIHSVTRVYPYELTLINQRICRGNIFAGSKESAWRIIKAKEPKNTVEIQIGEGCPYIAKGKKVRSFLRA